MGKTRQPRAHFVPLGALTTPQLTPDTALREIRSLYFGASEQTIQRDLAAAVALLMRLGSEDDRERATVYMEGLTEMRKDWAKINSHGSRKKSQKKRGEVG
jgi:hypothetical protein